MCMIAKENHSEFRFQNSTFVAPTGCKQALPMITFHKLLLIYILNEVHDKVAIRRMPPICVSCVHIQSILYNYVLGLVIIWMILFCLCIFVLECFIMPNRIFLFCLLYNEY